MKIARIIFWAVISFLCLVLGLLGIINNNRLYNEKKNMLENVVNIFNNNSTVKKYNDYNIKVNALLSKKNLVINYNEKKYTFSFKANHFTIKQDKNNQELHNLIMILSDSIAVYYGQENELTYPLFNKGEIYKLSLEDGISYKEFNNFYLVKINLNKYIKAKKI